MQRLYRLYTTDVRAWIRDLSPWGEHRPGAHLAGLASPQDGVADRGMVAGLWTPL